MHFITVTAIIQQFSMSRTALTAGLAVIDRPLGGCIQKIVKMRKERSK